MRIYSLLLAISMLPIGGASGADDKPAAGQALAALERFPGEWFVDGKWSDGNRLQARGVYEWSLDKKLLRTRTFVRDGDREYQRYEGFLAWHADKKCLFQVSLSCEGAFSETIVERKDADTLHVGWVPYQEGKPSPVRQVIRFIDNDHFRWVVSVREGDGWKQIMDATWQRKKK